MTFNYLNGHLSLFSSHNNVDYTNVSTIDGEFYIKIDPEIYEFNSAGSLEKIVLQGDARRSYFEDQFGAWGDAKGKKIVFILASHDYTGDENGNLNETQIEDIKDLALNLKGNVDLDIREAVVGNGRDFTVGLKGPSFVDHPGSFSQKKNL